MNLDSAIRKVPDFPKPGILFYDITSIFTNPEAFSYVFEKMDEIYPDGSIDGVIAIESRGFIVGSPFALRKKIPMVLARKKGKLPGKTIEQSYSLEYGEATLQIHSSDLKTGGKWLIVDDLVATGGTIDAVAQMVEREGGVVAGVFSIIGLPFLDYDSKIGKYDVRTLVDYHGE